MPVRRSAPFRAGRLLAVLGIVAIAATACVPGSGGAAASPTPTLAPTPSPSANPYTGAAAGSGNGIKIGYVSYGEQVPYVASITAGIRSEAQKAGADLVVCDAALDQGKVDACMKQLSDAGVKGIIQFQGLLKDPAIVCGQVAANVPVVAIEFAQDPCAATLVRADDLRAGQIAGAAVGAWVKASWSCQYDAYVSFESASAPERSQMRMEGYRQGFLTVCPGVAASPAPSASSASSPAASGSPAAPSSAPPASASASASASAPGASGSPAPTVAAGLTNEQIGTSADRTDTARDALLELLPNLAGKSRILVVAMNDDGALGALDGASQAGRSNDVYVSGQGADSRVRDLIRTNAHYLGDSAYFPEKYGASAVPALLDLIAGKSVPKLLLVEPAWVDKATIGQIYP